MNHKQGQMQTFSKGVLLSKIPPNLWGRHFYITKIGTKIGGLNPPQYIKDNGAIIDLTLKSP